MASISQDISIQVSNNLNREATFTLLGGTQDPSNGQANSKNLYEWDLSSETFSNTTVIEIQASTVESPDIVTYTATNPDGVIADLQTAVNLLNTLNLGVFNLDGNVIWILNDINIFGDLFVKISQQFDIDLFVESAYNYFDPEAKTTLVDFSTKYKPLIEEAIANIPTFVEFIETQGWSLAFVSESDRVRLFRNISGDIYVITETSGTFSQTIFSGTDSVNSLFGFDKFLIFTFDINIYLNATFFEARAKSSPIQSVIYKYVFKNSLWSSASFNEAWKPLSPNYFPNPLEATHTVQVTGSLIALMDDYGNSFPSINIDNDAQLQISGVNSGLGNQSYSIGAIGQNAELNFGQFSSGSKLILSRIISLNDVIDINFSTLNLVSDFSESDFQIFIGNEAPQTVNLDSSFNTKFNNNNVFDSFGDDFSIEGVLGGADNPTIVYSNTITELILNFFDISFRSTYTENLPPIQEIGVLNSNGGAVNTFDLDLDITEQSNPANISMRYFNDWFFKVGTQDKIYDNSLIAGIRIIRATSNTFLLSGRGLQGYYSIGNSSIPTGSLLAGGILSFTVTENPPTNVLLKTTTAGLGQSDFEITFSEDGQTDTVQSSTFLATNQEQIDIGSATGNEKNVLMTQRPTLDTSLLEIGTQGFDDQFSTMFFSNELFNSPIEQLNIRVAGLTLNCPVSDAVNGEVDYSGLYQRDFSQAFGGVSSSFTISNFKINGTNLVNGGFIPITSRSIFNFPTGSSRFNTLIFKNCVFGTDYVDTTLGTNVPNLRTDLLNLLIPKDAITIGGISFSNCLFNGVDNSNTYLEISFHIASDYDLSFPFSVQGLSGVSNIENTQFSQSQPDRLLFNSDWDGNGEPLTSLTINSNTNLEQINLSNSNTATPNALNLNISNNAILEVLNFTNHNVVSAIVNNNPLINNIDLSGNDLPDSEIDNILNEVNSYGTSNGTIDYSSQTGGGVPTAIGSGTAYNNLISRGWTLIGASPFGTNIGTYTVNQTQAFARPTVYNWEFNETGDLLFIFSGANFEKYPLTTPFDISTLGAISQSVAWNSSPSFFPFGSQVWDSGNYLFVTTIGVLRRWTFGTPNDLTTISSLASAIQSSNLGLGSDFTFNPSGTKFYNLTGTQIDEYSLTAWNPTTLTSSGSKTYASMGLTSIPIPDVQRRISLRFNSSGTLAIISMGQSASPFDALVYLMNLTIAFDITTMSYSGNSLDISDKPNEWVNKVGADSNLTKIIPLYLQTGGYPTNSIELKEWS